MNDIPEMHRSQ